MKQLITPPKRNALLRGFLETSGKSSNGISGQIMGSVALIRYPIAPS
jgi:hypothetical protein